MTNTPTIIRDRDGNSFADLTRNARRNARIDEKIHGAHYNPAAHEFFMADGATYEFSWYDATVMPDGRPAYGVNTYRYRRGRNMTACITITETGGVTAHFWPTKKDGRI